ncbi:MAG: ClpXP protease specificity-enhancing factor [Betaproteobacteria bacterium]|nr:ClpXP protease specificity-enhancing factor [Betaproteobacteria bacterium]MBU6512260.1 ClpXP protease specificity-enhancing factor [Betaproteobacteria bacterium]
MTDTAEGSTSTKPYLLRALYEWCCDNGFTPHLAVRVDSSVRVPREHVRNGEIVLNISFGATSGLNMGNDEISFRARFGGVARDIVVPVSHVNAIYARENGQGMAFPVGQPDAGEPGEAASESTPAETAPQVAPALAPAPAAPAGGAPRLHAVPASGSDAAAGRKGPDDDEPEPPPRAPGSHLKRVK